MSRYTPDEHGGWLMDPAPRDPEDFHKIWTTSGSSDINQRRTLYEFANEDKYRKGFNKNEKVWVNFLLNIISGML